MDRNKTVKGLETCANVGNVDGIYCTGCPYDDEPECMDVMSADALELIKSLEPHVMTIDEIENALDTVVWVEEKDEDENTADNYYLITAYSHKERGVDTVGWKYGRKMFGYEMIGTVYRFWNKRPYEEQRKAVAW